METPACDAGRRALFERELRAPRYTSYPTALSFTAGVGDDAYRDGVARSNGDPLPAPLSLYVHLPFCASGCFYCGCNKVVSRSAARHQRYVEALRREITRQARLFASDRRVNHLHFGGGTPNFIANEQLRAVVEALRDNFRMAANAEVSLEIDPRQVAEGDVAVWSELGVNRISIGVQDVDAKVQRLINRVQSPDSVTRVTQVARMHGMRSINFDLIYGLPGQTADGFAQTLEFVAAQRPDRVAVFHYAHMPERFAGQRAIDARLLPDVDARAALQALAHRCLTGAGYVAIGLDHYALPTDSLARAYLNGDLHRNFQGYSTHDGCDVVGLGASSISHVGNVYAQNEVDPDAYVQRMDGGGLAHVRGYVQDADDRLRELLIQDIMCRTAVSFGEYTLPPGQTFESHFARDLKRLVALDPEHRFVTSERHGLCITAEGRRHLRLIAQCFDAYNADPPPTATLAFSTARARGLPVTR